RNAARKLCETTGGWVLVSRGAQGGLLVGASLRGCYRATAPRVRSVNTVGAGDAMLAAVVHQMERHSAVEEWLRWGIAVGTAATQCLAGALPPRALLEEMAAGIKVQRGPWRGVIGEVGRRCCGASFVVCLVGTISTSSHLSKWVRFNERLLGSRRADVSSA